MRPTKTASDSPFALSRGNATVLVRALVEGHTVVSGVLTRHLEAAMLAARDTTLADEGFVVLGISFGGEAGLLAGVHFPELVHGLVTCTGGAPIVSGSVPNGDDAAWTLAGKAVPPRTVVPIEKLAGPAHLFGAGEDGIANTAQRVEGLLQRARTRSQGHRGKDLPGRRTRRRLRDTQRAPDRLRHVPRRIRARRDDRFERAGRGCGVAARPAVPPNAACLAPCEIRLAFLDERGQALLRVLAREQIAEMLRFTP